MTYDVYTIINPIDDRPFYIGYSADFMRRKKQHIEGTDQISGQIIRQIKHNGFVPLFSILEAHDNEETALRAEIFWIETMLSRGLKLMNAQAFDGFQGRAAKRRIETSKADNMATLKKTANGRTSKRTNPISADGWTLKDTKRLIGMDKKGMPLAVRAKLLNRSVDDIQAKLKDASSGIAISSPIKATKTGAASKQCLTS